jgi:hypothetical protein
MVRSLGLITLPALALIGAWAPASDEAVRHALAVLAESPLDKKGDAALATIVDFAEKSDKVEITIAEGGLPWVGKVPHSELLLGAFIAGNLRSQLDSGVTRSDAYSGMLEVFAVYSALKAKEPKFSVPSIDGFLEQHRRGDLITALGAPSGAAATDTASAGPAARPAGYAPPNGLVPDADTAIRIAVAVWDPIYGADKIAGEKPYVAKVDGDTGTVTGSLLKGMAGGVAEAHINKQDGRIQYVSHGE